MNTRNKSSIELRSVLSFTIALFCFSSIALARGGESSGGGDTDLPPGKAWFCRSVETDPYFLHLTTGSSENFPVAEGSQGSASTHVPGTQDLIDFLHFDSIESQKPQILEEKGVKKFVYSFDGYANYSNERTGVSLEIDPFAHTLRVDQEPAPQGPNSNRQIHLGEFHYIDPGTGLSKLVPLECQIETLEPIED